MAVIVTGVPKSYQPLGTLTVPFEITVVVRKHWVVQFHVKVEALVIVKATEAPLPLGGVSPVPVQPVTMY